MEFNDFPTHESSRRNVKNAYGSYQYKKCSDKTYFSQILFNFEYSVKTIYEIHLIM